MSGFSRGCQCVRPRNRYPTARTLQKNPVPCTFPESGPLAPEKNRLALETVGHQRFSSPYVTEYQTSKDRWKFRETFEYQGHTYWTFRNQWNFDYHIRRDEFFAPHTIKRIGNRTP